MHDDRLHAIEIRRFRGLAQLELDGLGAFNLLLGANDIGKTSVLEAVFLLAGFADVQSPVRLQNWRNLLVQDFDDLGLLFHGLDVDAPVALTAHSDGPVKRRTLEISAAATARGVEAQQAGNGSASSMTSAVHNGDQSSSTVAAGARVLRYDATVEPRQGSPTYFAATLEVSDGDLRAASSGTPAAEPTISARYIGPRTEYDGAVIADVTVDKKADRLIRYLRAINPRVQSVATNGNVAYVDVGLERMIPLNMYGSGVTRAAMMLAPCIAGNERILLIDELENGLHHAAMVPLLQALLTLTHEQRLQVFATTHSIAPLESLRLALNDERFSAFRDIISCYSLQRDQDGLVRPYRYDYAQFEHCIARGIEIR
ncbi:MAG: AAA family ATPase [Spirochaetaceae bacterium]|nr:AAA family ATPase [Spirochaetaceae bacterium]